MALRINDTQMMLTKPADMTADRARDQRLSGFNIDAMKQTEDAAEANRHRIRHTEETEQVRVRPDGGRHESEEHTEGERRTKDTLTEDGDELHKKAAQQLLNLPVQQRRPEEGLGFDISV